MCHLQLSPLSPNVRGLKMPPTSAVCTCTNWAVTLQGRGRLINIGRGEKVGASSSDFSQLRVFFRNWIVSPASLHRISVSRGRPGKNCFSFNSAMGDDALRNCFQTRRAEELPSVEKQEDLIPSRKLSAKLHGRRPKRCSATMV